MGTKSKKSSGTQHNQRGVTQGNTLVDPKSGLPISVIEDLEGNRRLAVDGQFTATIENIGVDLDGTGVNGDSVHIVDNVSGNKLKINPDGTIDSNVEIDAADGDNIAVADPTTGDKLKVESDGSINTNSNTVQTPTIHNQNIPTANIEYSYNLPSGTKKFSIRTRGNAKIQLAFVSSQSGTNFITIFPGNRYEEQDLKITSLTMYFQLSKSNETIEILSWA